MSRVWTITLGLALLAGAIAAVVLYPRWSPRWSESRALHAITSRDAVERAAGWEWLVRGDAPGGSPRAASRLEIINDRLNDSSDEALVDGAARLRAIDLWGWTHQDRSLVWRELQTLARASGEQDQGLAIETFATVPLDADAEQVEATAGLLLASVSAEVRRASFVNACGWAGRDRPDSLLALPIPGDDVELHRLRALALARCRPIPRPDSPPDLGIDEATALWSTLHAPDDASAVLTLLHEESIVARAGMEYVLRYSRDPRALRELERRAEAGNDLARYVLHARTRHVDEDQARRVVSDSDQPPSRRRLAAWRWDRIPATLVAELLDESPAEEDGTVGAAVLLAERRLPRDDAIALAERWIRSFDDDEKRAGALLAALLDEHEELLEQAFALEDMADVRTTQRLALWALGRPLGPEDSVEFALRTLYAGASGVDFRADTVLCMLLAGDRIDLALALLTSRPTEDALSTRKRAWLIERFVPEWFEEVGRPVGGSRRALDLHFDALDALRLLTRRRLRLDPETKCYRSE